MLRFYLNRHELVVNMLDAPIVRLSFELRINNEEMLFKNKIKSQDYTNKRIVKYVNDKSQSKIR